MAGPRPKYTKAQIAEQQRQCVELKVAGKSFESISASVGVAVETVQTRISQWFAAHPPAGADQMRETLMLRYEELYAALRPACSSGDTDAIDTTLDIFAAVRKMQGLDAPTRIDADVNHRVSPDDIELVRMISKLEGSNRALVQGHAETGC